MIDFPLVTVLHEDEGGNKMVLLTDAPGWSRNSRNGSYRTTLRSAARDRSYDNTDLAPFYHIEILREEFHSQEPLAASVKHWQLAERFDHERKQKKETA